MHILILIVHIVVSLILIAVILLQAGRGGGLADMFGGGSQSILGTRASTFLTKATTVCAVLFLLTSLTLALMSAKQGRSLMEGAASRRAPVTTTKPVTPNPTTPPSAASTPAASSEAPSASAHAKTTTPTTTP